MKFTTDWFSHVAPIWEEIAVPRLRTRSGDGLEIGTFEGRSALWTLHRLLPQPSRRLLCIDFWEQAGVEARFDANCREAGIQRRIIKRKGPSGEVLRSLPPEPCFDWIYIDGSHEGRDCLTDAVLAFPLLNPGGILVFDDYEWQPRGRVAHPPQPAIDAFLMLWGDLITVLYQGYQVMVAKHGEPEPCRPGPSRQPAKAAK